MIRRHLIVFALLALSYTVPAVAQTVGASTGSINGTVTDKTKAVLPGVTVTISSSSLMGTRETLTDAEGKYRFAAVPPGEYRLVFNLPGFTTLNREAIRVTLGFTATVNVEMDVATQQETVTVTGGSPVVDTSATKITSNFDAEQIKNLPSARDFAALMAETPAAVARRTDVGGSGALTENSYTVYGTTRQAWPMVEGIIALDGDQLLYYTDLGSFSDVLIVTAAHTAEMPVRGVFSQMIAKSGGNTYHGNVYADYENKNFSARNIDDALIARGVRGGGTLAARDTNRIERYNDFNIDIGGYVIKDKWWWYASHRYNVLEANFPNFPVKPQYTKLIHGTAKMTYNLNPQNKLIAFYNYNNKLQPERFSGLRLSQTMGIHTSLDTPWDEIFPVGVWKAEYNAVLSDAAFFEARGGDYFYNFINRSRAPDKLRYEDVGNNEIRGGDRDDNFQRRRPQVWSSLSYFKRGWGGNHNFKFGGEWMDEWYKNPEKGHPGNIMHVLRNGAPLEIYLFETPNVSKSFLKTIGMYANDVWQLNDRVTLNVGLRWDYYKNYLEEQVHPATFFNPVETRFEPQTTGVFKEWGPRLGLTYDVSADGKTVAKINYGRYGWNPSVSGNVIFNPNPGLWFKRYGWSDLNANGRWDPGEEGVLIETAGGVTNEFVDPNRDNPVTHEVAGWIEREIMSNFGVRTGFVWRQERDPQLKINTNRPYDAFNVPVLVPDPGPDGVRGTADDGPGIPAFNLDPALLALRARNLITSLKGFPSDYRTWEMTATKRMSNRWSLLASFAQTWTRESVFNAVRVRGVSVFPYNSNQLINTVDGRNEFTTWQGKLHGTFELPRDVKLTPILRHQSGQPWARQIVASMNYGTEVINVEKVGARRLDNVTLLDLRVEKGVRLAGKRVSAFFDLFNIFNANPVETLVMTSGPSFLRPLTIVPPRIFRIGAKFEW